MWSAGVVQVGGEVAWEGAAEEVAVLLLCLTIAQTEVEVRQGEAGGRAAHLYTEMRTVSAFGAPPFTVSGRAGMACALNPGSPART